MNNAEIYSHLESITEQEIDTWFIPINELLLDINNAEQFLTVLNKHISQFRKRFIEAVNKDSSTQQTININVFNDLATVAKSETLGIPEIQDLEYSKMNELISNAHLKQYLKTQEEIEEPIWKLQQNIERLRRKLRMCTFKGSSRTAYRLTNPNQKNINYIVKELLEDTNPVVSQAEEWNSISNSLNSEVREHIMPARVIGEGMETKVLMMQGTAIQEIINPEGMGKIDEALDLFKDSLEKKEVSIADIKKFFQENISNDPNDFPKIEHKGDLELFIFNILFPSEPRAKLSEVQKKLRASIQGKDPQHDIYKAFNTLLNQEFPRIEEAIAHVITKANFPALKQENGKWKPYLVDIGFDGKGDELTTLNEKYKDSFLGLTQTMQQVWECNINCVNGREGRLEILQKL